MEIGNKSDIREASEKVLWRAIVNSSLPALPFVSCLPFVSLLFQYMSVIIWKSMSNQIIFLHSCNHSADGTWICSLIVSRDFQLFLFKDMEYFIVTAWAHWTVLICLLVFLRSYMLLHVNSFIQIVLSSWIMVWRDLPRGGLSESDWVAVVSCGDVFLWVVLTYTQHTV